MRSYCGLDFGTSNSTIATAKTAQPILVPLESGRLNLPSAIFYDETPPPAGSPLSAVYGRAAMTRYLDGYEGRLLRSIKSLLGTDLINAGTPLSGRQVSFVSVIADFLSEIKTRAETHIGAEITSVVQGRPVNFVDDDPAANRTAEATLHKILLTAGFKHIEFQYEPIAAGQYFASQTQNASLCLVVDIGGGTSDFSIINIDPSQKTNGRIKGDVIANAGIRLGGTNFDQVLSYRHVMPLLGLGAPLVINSLDAPRWIYSDLSTWSKINTMNHPKTLRDINWTVQNGGRDIRFERLGKVINLSLGHHVAANVEAAKIALSAGGLTDIDLSCIENDLGVALSSQALSHSLEGAMLKIGTAINTCLVQSGLKTAEIGTIILTGGSTEMPIVHQTIRQIFPHAEISACDAFGAVGIGLAIEAQALYGA